MQLIYDADGRPAGAVDDTVLTDLYRFPVQPDRPSLRSNFVMSLDGSIQGPDGRSGSINTPSDQHVFALQRALADAVLVGAGTVRAEGYRAVDLAPWQRDLRAAEGLAPFPVLVVVSASARVDPSIGTAVDGERGAVLVVTTAGKPDEDLDPLREAGIELLEVDGPRIDVGVLADQLAGSGLVRLLCEGGPQLHHDLLAAGAVDQLLLTVAPTVVGGAGLRSTLGGPLDPPDLELQFALFEPADGALFTCYRKR